MTNSTQPILAPQEMLNHICSTMERSTSSLSDYKSLFEDYFDRWDVPMIQRWTETDWTCMEKICNLASTFNRVTPGRLWGNFGTSGRLFQNLYSVDPVSNYLRFYNLFIFSIFKTVNMQARINLAKAYAQKEPINEVIGNIYKFDIDRNTAEGQQGLFELLEICAERDASVMVSSFQEFQIDLTLPGVQQRFLKIIKNCVETNGSQVIKNYLHFGIDPKLPGAQEAIFEIIRNCAKVCPKDVTINFPKFGIDPKLPGAQNFIFEIIHTLILAKGNLINVGGYFQGFGIDQKLLGAQDAIFEIIQIFAKKSGGYVASNFLNFGIDPFSPGAQQGIIKIAKICVKSAKGLQGCEKFILNFGIDAGTVEGLEMLIELAKNVYHFPDNIKERTNFTSTDLKWLKAIIQSANKNPNFQWQIIFQTTTTLLLWNSGLSDAQFFWVTEEQELLQKFFALRAPHLRDLIEKPILRVAKSALAREIMDKSSLALAGKYREAALIQVLCASLGSGGVNCEKLIDRLNKDLYKPFKDIASIKALLQMLLLLEASTLDPQSKQVVMDNLDQVVKKSIVLEIRAITTILLLKEDRLLNALNSSFTTAAIVALNRHLPPMEVENFSEKWQRTFGMSRDPHAIMTYVSNMNTLNDQNITSCLGKFISSVLNGTFTDDRYSLQTEHLKKVQTFLPLWRKNFEQTLEIQALDQVIFIPLKWLKLKLIVDKHLGNLSTTYPALARYLSDDPEEERKTDPELKPLEQLAIELANSTDASKQLQLLQQLEKIATGDFLNDIKAEITKLQQPLLPRRGLRTINTDNPFHLLLAGTDVQGSCQNVNGNPSLNCGLLGYLMNGQTRLLAIVDPSDKIVTRAMFRLLWDEKNQKPVLFFERIYGDARYQSVLEKLAQEKANEMGLVLTSLDGKGGYYGSPIESLDGVAPFEYCDAAANGVEDDSQFTIGYAQILGSRS